MPQDRSFRVRIHYQTPMHDVYCRRPTKTHSGTYEVVAPTRRAAIDNAVGQFRHMGALSSVSWTREIVRVECDGEDVFAKTTLTDTYEQADDLDEEDP